MLIVVAFFVAVGAGAWWLIYGLCVVAAAADERANAWRYSSSSDHRPAGEP